MSTHAVEGSGRSAGWFRRHRFRVVLWVAAVEGIVVAVTHGLHIATIIVLGVIAVACLVLYRVTKERTQSTLLHEVTWFLAASQLGATILVAAGVVLLSALIVLLVIFALVAVGLLLLDRR
jgi:hypothetical protein